MLVTRCLENVVHDAAIELWSPVNVDGWNKEDLKGRQRLWEWSEMSRTSKEESYSYPQSFSELLNLIHCWTILGANIKAVSNLVIP